jgi:hypothetical protein
MITENCNEECSCFKWLEEKDLFYCACTGKVVEKGMKCLVIKSN